MWKIERPTLKARNRKTCRSNNQVIGIDQQVFQATTDRFCATGGCGNLAVDENFSIYLSPIS